MKIKVICISDSDKHFSSAIDEYCKRLGKDLEIVTIKPEKNGSRTHIIIKETEKIIEKLSTIKDSYTILLAKEWKQLSTEQCTKIIERYNTLTFIIGGPYGVDHSLLTSHINDSIAFGSMTMPHGLAKLVLLEQIYRVKTIIEGREYHY
jgi:23S rRNA (pseudouridine1915-N3)-methyltransferase